MIRSAVTISLVPQAKGGPFVFWGEMLKSLTEAAKLGFDGVELFAPSGAALADALAETSPAAHNLQLAAVGTGAGWVLNRLTLSGPVAADRQKAVDFIRAIIDAGGAHGAPAIVGSMQGRCSDEVSSEKACDYLRNALNELGEHAAQYHVPLLFEPLNRYETNLINSLADGVRLLQTLSTKNVRLLADLFHMNIEEADPAGALVTAATAVGHVHFADSNRRPIGFGHSNVVAVADALATIEYDGYISAECLPWPDPDSAAAETIRAFRTFFQEPQ